MGFLDIAMRNYEKIKKEERKAPPQKKSEQRSKGNVIELVAKSQVERLDEKARGAGLMIGIPGELYTVTLSKVSSIYIERKEGRWEARRETHYPDNSKAVSSKTIARASTFDCVLPKVNRYLDYIDRKRGDIT